MTDEKTLKLLRSKEKEIADMTDPVYNSAPFNLNSDLKSRVFSKYSSLQGELKERDDLSDMLSYKRMTASESDDEEDDEQLLRVAIELSKRER